MNFTKWIVQKSYDAVNADGKVSDGSFEAILNDGSYSMIKAVSVVEGLSGGGLWEFSYSIEKTEGVIPLIAYTWLDDSDNILFRAHAVPGEYVVCPDNATKAELNACFYGYDGGKAKIHSASVNYVKPYEQNKVSLAAIMISYDGAATVEKNIKACAERIDAAAAEGADLVLLPETYNTIGIDGLKPGECAAAMNDPAVTMLRDKAKEHGIYTSASLKFKREDGIVSNTVVIFDRKGELVGEYTKAHLTMYEIWNGSMPGREIKTFDTDIGRIGCSICWDRFFPEHHRLLFLQKADIVLNPTASGAYPIESAHSGYPNAAFIVTAHVTEDPNLTRITDRLGNVIATADPKKGYAIATVDVNAYAPVFWLSAPDADTDPRSVYMHERRVDLYGPLSET